MTMLRSSSDTSSGPSSGPSTSTSGTLAPVASRAQAPGWRDPRVAIGVVIVAVSVLIGARVLAGADDTIAVWSVRNDVPTGSTLEAGDLVSVRVHFAGDGADRYLPVAADLDPGTTVTRDLGAGELV